MIITASPLRGRMLDVAVLLDCFAPGFAGAYLRSSNERRQVVAAFCALVEVPDTSFGEVANFLQHAGHKSILQATFRDVPVGLRGALRRAGAQPHGLRFYVMLHQSLAAPRHPAIAQTIQGLTKIDFERLRIVNILPEEICSPGVVEIIGDRSVAKDVAALVDLLAARGVDRPALARAICSVSHGKQLSKLWDRWISDCALPRSPLDDVPGCRPARTAGELFELARRYRNCAGRYAPEALEGSSAFGELLPEKGQPGLVVHLRQRLGTWMIEGLFLKQNGRPDPDERERAYARLTVAGVKQPKVADEADGEWSSLRRLTFRPIWDFGYD